MKADVTISVRNLIEFLLRQGDISSGSAWTRDTQAMQMGAKLHRKIQKSMGDNYRAEVSLEYTTQVEYMPAENEIAFSHSDSSHKYAIKVEGRADGIIRPSKAKSCMKSYVLDDGGEPMYNDRYIIDEIKCSISNPLELEEPIFIHEAQAMCYAYMLYRTEDDFKNEEEVVIRLSYCQINSGIKKYFHSVYSKHEIFDFYDELMQKYAKWIAFEKSWRSIRDKSINELEFPFEYRENQNELVKNVYRTILREKKLFLEAPTGVGKTISTTFPSVKAMGTGLINKLFYLTARTTTKDVAFNALAAMKSTGLKIKAVNFTAKDKVCILEKPDCNPESCERAKGHFDRVNDATFDLINHEELVTKQIIEEYATKHCVCPFELAADVSLWCDAIIGDYNYVFDPTVYLKRYFQSDKKQPYMFIIDEAHNLVARARDMYSATLIKEDFLAVNNIVKVLSPSLSKHLVKCNKLMLEQKRLCDNVIMLDPSSVMSFVFKLMEIIEEMDKFFGAELPKDFPKDFRTELLNFYFEIRNFVNIYDSLGEEYTIYNDFGEGDEFRITLRCMNPSRLLDERFAKGRSAVLMSATMLPVDYYMDQLAGNENDYAIYVPSPFDKSKRIIMIANDVDTKYTSRHTNEYMKIAGYLKDFISCKSGNYLVFFPSYKYMNCIYELMGEIQEQVICQSTNMDEEARQEFIEGFTHKEGQTLVGFAVLGGVFSEGIDLTGDRLIGVAIVGTGLAMVCNEREIFRDYYDKENGEGFLYSYLYDGMNKVLQSAGRLIRTENDEGAILLLDKRLLTDSYKKLYPYEWYPFTVVNRNNMRKALEDFYNDKSSDI